MEDSLNEYVLANKNKKDAQDELEWLLPNASRVFNPQTALITLTEMLVCLEEPQVYELNDYHYLLLYDALEHLCVIHNDSVKESKNASERIENSKVGDYHIEELLFNDIIDIYFYDVDFLLNKEETFELGLEGRKKIDISDESFAITQGLTPHPEELKIRVHKGDKAILPDSSPYFGRRSRVYPDFDYKREHT